MKLTHFFLPHPQTHKKAHLISWQAILIYILLFFIIRVGVDTYSQLNPGVLGVESSITQAMLIELTNQERVEQGLPALLENPQLNEAAAQKANNMFEEDYWAHFAPSGKTPWDFIKGAGYKFAFAGENLARNFYTSEEVIEAWMNSPTHRDNILNNRYQEIGIAVVEGVLKGQKTTLVVQEFGAPVEFVAEAPSLQNTATPAPITAVAAEAGSSGIQTLSGNQIAFAPRFAGASSLDPYFLMKISGTTFLAIFALLVALDLYIIRRRAVIRLGSRHWPHLILFGIAASALAGFSPGSIL